MRCKRTAIVLAEYLRVMKNRQVMLCDREELPGLFLLSNVFLINERMFEVDKISRYGSN